MAGGAPSGEDQAEGSGLGVCVGVAEVAARSCVLADGVPCVWDEPVGLRRGGRGAVVGQSLVNCVSEGGVVVVRLELPGGGRDGGKAVVWKCGKVAVK